MPFATFWNTSVLNHIFGKLSYAAPSNIYVGLSSTTPAPDGSNVTEPSAGAYARVSTSPSDWNTASGNSISLSSLLTFPTATADWAAVTYFVLYTASSNGTFLGFGQLDVPTTVLNTEIATFASGAIVVSLT